MQIPDISTFDGAYTLGLIWGCGAVNRGNYLFRIIYHQPLLDIKNGLKLNNQVFKVESGGKLSYELGIYTKADIDNLLKWLNSLGWLPKDQTHLRPYPSAWGLNNEGFISGWCCLHSLVDAVRVHNPMGALKPRVKIFGSEVFLWSMSEIIAGQLGLRIVKPQRSPNTITKVLCYQCSSAEKVCDWLGLKRGD